MCFLVWLIVGGLFGLLVDGFVGLKRWFVGGFVGLIRWVCLLFVGWLVL